MSKKLNLFLIIFFFSFALPGFCQEEVTEMTKEIQDPVSYNAFAEFQKIGYNDINMSALLDKRVVLIIQKMFQDNQLQKESPAEVRQLILEKSKGKPFEWFFKNHPKLLDTCVAILRDKKAMPSLVGILLRQKDLKNYFLLSIAFLIAGALIKRFMFPKKWPASKRMLMGVLLSLGISLFSLTIFYNMFYEEVSPTTKIIVNHWRRRNL